MRAVGRAPQQGHDASKIGAAFDAVTATRAEPMLRALAPSPSALLLVGEPGSAMNYLAEYVGRILERDVPGGVRVFTLPHFATVGDDPALFIQEAFADAELANEAASFDWVSETFRAGRVADRIVSAAQASSGSAEPLFILPRVDSYSTRAAAVLEHILRHRVVRVIGTAHSMRSGASQMARDPGTTRIVIEPLDLAEADTLTSSLLGSGRLAPETLRRWHLATGGSWQALALMVIANERSGTLRRSQGVVRVPTALEVIPEEFIDRLRDTCTVAEIEVLEMIALVAPMSEAPLLRLLNSAATQSLFEKSLLTSQTAADGHAALRFKRSIVGAAIRAHMSPLRKIELADRMYLALTESERPQYIARAVELGLESGRALPHDWLTVAAAQLLVTQDPRLALRVSLELALNYRSAEAAAAAVRAVSYAVQLGDSLAVETAHRRIGELLHDQGLRTELPCVLLTRLQLAQIERAFFLGASVSDVLGRLDALEAACGQSDEVSLYAVRGLRSRLLLRNGDFVAAAAAMPEEDHAPGNLIREWVGAPARSAAAVLMMQQGRLDQGIGVAQRARSMSAIGRRPLNDILELQGFYWFLGHWGSGSAEGARRALEEIEADASASHNDGAWLSSLVDAGWAMLALQEARWSDAAGLFELVIDWSSTEDLYGMQPLLNAGRALALAALGKRSEALAALHRARESRRGVSQVAAGFRRRLIVQTMQWLQLEDPAAEAMRLAEWARGQGLSLIELEALHIAAIESRVLACEVVDRALKLADDIDPLISEVLVSHIEKISTGSSPSDVSESEVRLLAELGLWTPLPETGRLSAREREVSLLAALGYSSRTIAERFHLSVRTVETHLAHVYAKIGVTDREALRDWFSEDRRTV